MDPPAYIDAQKTVFSRSLGNANVYSPVGVFSSKKIVTLVFQDATTSLLHLSHSTDGFSFIADQKPIEVPNGHELTQVTFIHSFVANRKTNVIFQTRAGDTARLKIGTMSTHAVIPTAVVDVTSEPGYIVSDFTYRRQRVMYYGSRAVHAATSSDLRTWKAFPHPVLTNAVPMEVGGVFKTEHGILVLYFKKEVRAGITLHDAHLALFDAKSPTTILWKTTEPIWRQSDHWMSERAIHIGTVMVDHQLRSYWRVNNHVIYCVHLSGFTFDPATIVRLKKKTALAKHVTNPIIKPNPANEWESFNTFNPAAVYIDNKVHILYRAQGFDYISSVGYASSKDGIAVDERLDKPVFSPTMNFEQNTTGVARTDFVSGGGFGGCEDPRITHIDNRIYMTYVAFDGYHPPRLALTSILLTNFLAHRWFWSKPVLISPPGMVDKSGCLLSEKVRGKYVFFHRVFPNILIDFVDDLTFGENKWLKGEFQIKVRKDKWDSRKIGAGAPPIKTPDGWLLIYYGVDDRDAGKYHIGAMLLDLADPTKVLFRTDAPILQPTEHYEWNGFKPGVAYPCGAVVIDDTLLVYYGAADSHVCVATALLTDFLTDLKAKRSLHLTPATVREITYS